MHCVIPPHFEFGESRSTSNGQDTKNFTNYIKTSEEHVLFNRETISCIKIDSSDLRYLKGHTR